MTQLRFLSMCLAVSFLIGCTSVLKREDILLEAQKIKAASNPKPVETTLIQPPLATPPVAQEIVAQPVSVPRLLPLPLPNEQKLISKEKLIFKATYLGLPVGEFIMINNGKTMLNGKEVYCFEMIAKNLPFFTAIFGAKDHYISYMDAQKFIVLRHEEYIKGGNVLESIVDFDYENHQARTKNVLNGHVKTIPIPDKVLDVLSGGFYLRMLPLRLGDTSEFDLYADDKIYNFLGLLFSQQQITLPNKTTHDVYLFKPYVFFNGIQIKKVSAEVLLSTSEQKTPFKAILKSPLGNVSVILEQGNNQQTKETK